MLDQAAVLADHRELRAEDEAADAPARAPADLDLRLNPELAACAPTEAPSPAAAAPADATYGADGFRVWIDLPGVDPDTVKLSALGGGVLRVSAERAGLRLGDGEALFRCERPRRVCRVLRLPRGADIAALRARLEQGVLLLTIPTAARA